MTLGPSGAPARTATGPALPGNPVTGSGSLVEVVCGTFPGEPSQVRCARRFISDLLGPTWPRLDDVLVLASEISSNAVRHTASGNGGKFEVAVSVFAAVGAVRVAVTDQGSPSEPAIASGTDGDGESGLLEMSSGGRGLRIVDVMADRWGHRGSELGRTVWFEVAANPAEN
jgi:serine/threonine-protein kinase RsbW